jgi:Sec-independent protein secretion pathway component TatC
MEPKLAALLTVGELTAADLVVSVVTMALGAFATVSPRRAAEIWASERLRNMTYERQALFVRWYRIFGIILFAGGALFAHSTALSRH